MIVIIIEKFFAHVTVIVLATKVIRNSMLFSITKMSGQKKERKKKTVIYTETNILLKTATCCEK